MDTRDERAYYRTQSALSAPGKYAALFADLPDDIASLCAITRGLVVHYKGAGPFGQMIPKARLREINLRSVRAMLHRIAELDGRSLTLPRPPAARLVGCCRDFALLACAVARSRGIPARVRIGLAAYIEPAFHVDHAVLEYWDAGLSNWYLADPGLGPETNAANAVAVDPLDVPRDQFLVAGLAWQRCRAGIDDPGKFGVAPGSALTGVRFIRDKLIQDLAALNKVEVLLWDAWGLMLGDDSDATEFTLLDEVARATQASSAAFSRLRAVYEETVELRVPERVRSFSPVTRPVTVHLGT